MLHIAVVLVIRDGKPSAATVWMCTSL